MEHKTNPGAGLTPSERDEIAEIAHAIRSEEPGDAHFQACDAYLQACKAAAQWARSRELSYRGYARAREYALSLLTPVSEQIETKALLEPPEDDPYVPLHAALMDAYLQASGGKGRARHASEGQNFLDQPMMTITREMGLGFPLGQSMKKTQEAIGMAERKEFAAARAELLGAINYLAGAYIHLLSR